MLFDSKKILKELYDNEETCSFKIDCVMDGDFDDIRRIIEDECEYCGVSDRLAKKVRILKNDDNCYTICCPSKEVCDLLSNKFEEIEIYGKPSNEAKDYRSSIEKYNAEDDIVEPDKSKGKFKIDGDTMYAEDGDCGMTSGDAGAYDAPFEIPTKYSKKQMDMIRRGTLESRMISKNIKEIVKENSDSTYQEYFKNASSELKELIDKIVKDAMSKDINEDNVWKIVHKSVKDNVIEDEDEWLILKHFCKPWKVDYKMAMDSFEEGISYYIEEKLAEDSKELKESKKLVKESVEEDLFDSFYKDIKDNYKYYDYRTSDLKTFDRGDLIEFLYRFMTGSKFPKSFEEIQQLSDYENYKNMATSLLDAWTKYDLVEDIRNNHRLYEFK